MSKCLQPTVYVDENISSIQEARNSAASAERSIKELKMELWGLVMATPKDVVQDGKDPISEIKERFDYLMDDLIDCIVDEYKYNIVADDAEFGGEESLVKKQWEEEEIERKKYEAEQKKRNDFFKLNKDVLNPYNFDDISIYKAWSNGELELTMPLTEQVREDVLNELKIKEQELIKNRIKELKGNE